MWVVRIEMSVSEILNIGSAAAGVTSVLLNFVKYEEKDTLVIIYKKMGKYHAWGTGVY